MTRRVRGREKRSAATVSGWGNRGGKSCATGRLPDVKRATEESAPFALAVPLLALPSLVRKVRLDCLLELTSFARLDLLRIASSAPVLAYKDRLLLAGVKDLIDVGGSHRPVRAFRLRLEPSHDEPLLLQCWRQ